MKRLPSLLLSLLLLAGCNKLHEHDKAGEHAPHAEANAHDDHGHGGHAEHEGADTGIAVTHFAPQTELFVEFPAFVVGQESAFAAHLTRLDNFKPVASGKVVVTLSGGGVPDEVFSVDAPSVAGIFRPVVIPKHAVKRQVVLELQAEGVNARHELGEYQVYATQQQAEANVKPEDKPKDAIPYLKEQQWKVDFALTQAQSGSLQTTVSANGTIRPRADGEVRVNAVSAGHLRFTNLAPHIGMAVRKGQLLGTLHPKLASGSDLANLKAERDKAQSHYQLAQQEHERLNKLWQQEAIAQARVEVAANTLQVNKTELEAAEKRYAQAQGKPQSGSGIPVFAPISGVIAQTQAANGQFVEEGSLLFHIINLDTLWLEARVAEANLGKLRNSQRAWFSVEGFDSGFDTAELKGRLIGSGGVVDAQSRTVPYVFEFNNPAHSLRAGMAANVRLYGSEQQNGVLIPASAVYDDGGQEVVYVMLGGESYQRRVVQLGTRNAKQVLVLSGVNAGEYVVSKGAYLVRLASASPAEAGHGHAH